MKRTQLVIRFLSSAAFVVRVGEKRQPEVGPTGNSSRRVKAHDTAKKETKEAFDVALAVPFAV